MIQDKNNQRAIAEYLNRIHERRAKLEKSNEIGFNFIEIGDKHE
ncbi:hypothetical protein NZNM25_00670 [Nitrosopumilus zosterae]|uniref:Uncharacterized protein n=1 Tax=Nitrosopumilus zosterae TaxID=718286 RepID=A0A2S2KNS2_9ARCH|nr:hypothetical protein [Nitrosopumilus zosterae]GBH33276.1 hypothetical protein NZNM25_00670 [Nitrosopumilus zosterae]